MNRKLTITAFIAVIGAAVAGGLAYAKSSRAENDAIADLATAKITLTQAIGAAEAHAGGRAVKAELGGERDALAYEVEVITTDRGVFDIQIDATDGKVLSSKQDPIDRSEKADQKD